MGPDRWERIDRLYHAALAQPADRRAPYLAEACGADEELRREIESLLAQPASADSAFTRGAAIAAAGLASDVGRSVLAGRRLGAYQILAPIGAGGMGEVYRARDTRLGRDVAIKILPRGFTDPPERLARFEREARVLASLNHPHISAIHGIEDLPIGNGESVRALVLELVEGETLAERIARTGSNGLPLKETLEIARQIAEALDAAHEKGIVHRDLKPANIKITPQGAVKVLDFGLAKLEAGHLEAADGMAEVPTITVNDTREGLIVGTAAYMSPEQARGHAVDKRTDIWAFGCVLYEMLTGRRAFSGDTLTDTLAAILEREPDWRVLPEATPSTIRHLLQQCLEKDSKRRRRDIGDARIDIDDALSLTGSPQSPRATQSSAALRLWRTVAIVSVVALVLGAVTVAWLASRSRSTPTATPVTAAQLTSYGGSQSVASLAPDGRSFVFVSDHGGSSDIWLRQVSGGEPVRLTNDAFEEADVAFAPDGESVYFTRVDATGEAIWQIGTLGGEARKVIASGHSPAPSPDGRTLAYMTTESQDLSEALVVSMLDGSAKRTLARQVPSFPRVRPAWSRDGRAISYVRGGLYAPSNLFVIDISTGRERQVTRFTRPPEGVQQHMWLPDNRHLVVSYAPYSRSQVVSDLAILDVNDGSITRLTTSVADIFGAPSVSADGSRLIATATGLLREVWKVPLRSTDPDVNGRAAVRLIDATQAPLWTFVTRDAKTLLFNSPASGSRNLWIMPLDGSSKPRQITTVPGDAIAHSSLSPDGTRVVFVSLAGGASDLWTQNVDGSDLRQLTNDPAADSWPVWSPDGRSIAFGTARDGVLQISLVPSEGGAGEKLIDGFFRGDWVEKVGSAGTWIVTSNNADRIRLIDVEKRSVLWEERVAGAQGSLPMFSPDRRSISVAVQDTHQLQVGNRAASADAVAILDVATRKQRIAARLPFRIVFRAAWADNGTALIVNRNDFMSHIVMFDRFWEPEGN